MVSGRGSGQEQRLDHEAEVLRCVGGAKLGHLPQREDLAHGLLLVQVCGGARGLEEVGEVRLTGAQEGDTPRVEGGLQGRGRGQGPADLGWDGEEQITEYIHNNVPAIDSTFKHLFGCLNPKQPFSWG